jgi:hypothetical protein
MRDNEGPLPAREARAFPRELVAEAEHLSETEFANDKGKC